MESRDNSHSLPIKDKLLQLWWKMDRTIFPITQRMGFHITKTHFYSPIPDTRDLPDSLWEKQNDMLFIDSSHILKIGSDVHYLYTEVLPKRSNGVVVHIHDVYLPQEYPKDFVKRRHCFNSEQYILQAFLTFNDRFRVLWGSNYMRLYHPEALLQAFPSFDPQKSDPESFWIQRVKG